MGTLPRPRPARRRSLPGLLVGSAWQLAAACAAIFSAAFFGALAISFFLRPTRRYLFPLLSDIDAHHPESAILRSGTFLATVLLCATAAAAFATVAGMTESAGAGRDGGGGGALMCEEMEGSDIDDHEVEVTELPDSEVDHIDDGETLLYVGDTSLPAPTRGGGSSKEANRVLRQLRHRLAVATRANRRALGLVVVLTVTLVAMLWNGGVSRLAVAAGAGLSAAPPKTPAVAAAAATVANAGEAGNDAGAVAGTVFVLYFASALWTGLLVYLVWFFLWLQSTACLDTPALSGDSLQSDTTGEPFAIGNTAFGQPSASPQAPSLSMSNLSLSAVSSTVTSVSSSLSSISASVSSSVIMMRSMDSDELKVHLAQRARCFGWYAVGVVRPVCLIAQVVSAIKILGLVCALNFFSIARIRLINTALLAALAFAEYTAAFFVSFFLVILAIDLRRATEDELLVKSLPFNAGSYHFTSRSEMLSL